MSEENKVINFPNTEGEVAAANSESGVPEETTEAPVAIENPDDPLGGLSMQNIAMMLKQGEEMVNTFRSIWESDMKEYKVSETNMRELYNWNEQHRTIMPEDISEEEKNNWDYFNGLDTITEEEVVRIFGEEHSIIGVQHTVTIDRIKTVTSDYFNWLTTLREYRQIHDAYLVLIESEEERNIEKLREAAEKEEDETKKAKMMESIDNYYNIKFLDFLKDPLTEKDIDRIVATRSDDNKFRYWTNRTIDKLKQLKVSTAFILEITDFEKKYIGDKYVKCANVLLLYFMQLAIYSSMSDKNDIGRSKVMSMIFALDGCIRNQWSEERKQRVYDNVKALCDQFMDKIPDLPPLEGIK